MICYVTFYINPKSMYIHVFILKVVILNTHYAAMGNSCVLLVSCNLNIHVRCILYQYLPVHFNWHNAMAGFLLGFTIYI